MKYKEFYFAESTGKLADIIVYFEDGTTKTVTNVPRAAIESPGFMKTLVEKLKKKYNKIVIKYQIVGDTTSQGNPDGNTPDTNNPTILTSPKGDDEVAQKPDEVKPQGGGTNFSNDPQSTDQKDADADKDTDADTDSPVDALQIQILAIDKQGYYVDQATGERLLDKFGRPIKAPKGQIDVDVPKLGTKGSEDEGEKGEEGKEGEEGEEGGAQEIEDWAERLYNAYRPDTFGIRADYAGTDEREIIAVLKEIPNKRQFKQVINKYYKTYDEDPLKKMAKEISHYVGMKPITKKWTKMINQELERFGLKLQSTPMGGKYVWMSRIKD